MGEAVDRAGNVWETDAQGKPVRFLRKMGPPGPPRDPTFDYKAPQAAATLENTRANIAATNASTNATNRKTALEENRFRYAQSKDAAAHRAEAAKVRERDKQMAMDAINVLRELDLMEADVYGGGFGETGWLGAKLGQIPGTAAHDLRTNVQTPKGVGIINKLIEAKQAMPSGAAGVFGATNEQELKALAAGLANLDPDNSNENFLKNIGDSRRGFLSLLERASPNAAKVYRTKRGEYEAKRSGVKAKGQPARSNPVVNFEDL